MAYNVQQEDIDILYQSGKELYVKLLLMDSNLLTLDELQGISIDGNISIASDSEIRITYIDTILLNNKASFNIERNKILLDKYVKVFMGIKNTRTSEIHYYPLGLFLFNEQNFVYDSVTNTLSVTCVDMMSNLNGVRSGAVSGLYTLIPAGEDIRSAMVAAVSQLGGIKKYLIDDVKHPVPYDLTFSAGSTVYNIIATLRDLYPGWETYFDEDGVFVCKQIPTCVDSNIVLDKEQMHKLVISENISNNFSEMRNKTEVWGASLSADRITDKCTNSGSQYNISLDLFEFKNRMKIAFKPNVTNATQPHLKINDLASYGIYYENEQFIEAERLKANTTYVVRYVKEKFYLMGEYQIYGVATDTNPDSPFYVGDNEENVALQVLSGGEYDNIYSDELCQQRAEYENWKSTRLTDTVSLEMILVPWLGVNQKIEYTSFATGETHQYITKNISFDMQSGVMSVQMIKFYPLYPNITSTRLEEVNGL